MKGLPAFLAEMFGGESLFVVGIIFICPYVTLWLANKQPSLWADGRKAIV